jgi:hypothetical protein
MKGGVKNSLLDTEDVSALLPNPASYGVTVKRSWSDCSQYQDIQCSGKQVAATHVVRLLPGGF